MFSRKRFSTTWPFPIFENNFCNGYDYWKTIFQNEIFINKLLNLIIIGSFLIIGKVQVVENLCLKKFGKKRYEKKHLEIKFVKYIIFLCFKFSFIENHYFSFE